MRRVGASRLTADDVARNMDLVLAIVAWSFWLLGHVPGPISAFAVPAWVATGLAVGLVNPWYGLLLTVVVVPFLGGAVELPQGEALRVVPVFGSAVRALVDRARGLAAPTAPALWVTVCALVAATLWLGTFWTFMQVEHLTLADLPFITWLLGGPVAAIAAWITASHVGHGRTGQLTDTVLVVTVVAVTAALLAWIAVPGMDLLTFFAAERGRLSAFGFPTPTGMGLAMALVFAFPAAWRRWRPGALILTAVILVAIVLTVSRGPLLALAAGVVAAFLLNRDRFDRRVFAGILAGGIMAGLGLALVRYGTDPASWIERAVVDFGGGDAIRIKSWGAAVTIALTEPLTGYGWHALARVSQEFIDTSTIQAHNLFLHPFAEGGWPLGITNGLVITWSTWLAWRNRHVHETWLIVAVVVFLVCGLWDIPQVRSYASVLGAIALGLVAVRMPAPADRPPGATRPAPAPIEATPTRRG